MDFKIFYLTKTVDYCYGIKKQINKGKQLGAALYRR